MSSFSFYPNALRDIDRAAAMALEKTAEAVHAEVVQAQVIPFRMGHLQNDSTFVDTSHSSQGYVEIVSSTPYARRLYFHPEYDFSQDKNPNAGAHWFDPWMDGGENADFVLDTFAKFLKQGAGL